MGANQALHDTADMLPIICKLRDLAASGYAPQDSDFAGAVKQYESEMIPRAFGWVQASGGTEMSVRD